MKTLLCLIVAIPLIAFAVSPDGTTHYLVPHKNDPKILQFQASQKDVTGEAPSKGNFILCNLFLMNKGETDPAKTQIILSIDGYHGHGDPDSYFFSLANPKSLQFYQEAKYAKPMPISINMAAKTQTEQTPIIAVICGQYRR